MSSFLVRHPMDDEPAGLMAGRFAVTRVSNLFDARWLVYSAEGGA